jgi:hypothetical protein
MDLGTSPYGRAKYSVKVADLVAAGAVLTFDFTLDTLPAGAILTAYLVKAPVAVAGPSIATAVAQLKLNATALGSTTNVFAVAAEPANAMSATAAMGNISSANVLKLTVTVTGANLNVANAGQIDVIVDYKVLG